MLQDVPGATTMDRGFLLLAAAALVLLLASFAFAALAIVLRIRNDRRARRQVRLQRRWEPAMLEILSGAAPPHAIFERVDDADALDFLEFLLEYARLLRGEERGLIQAIADPYLPRVIPALREGTAESRGHAVLILARMGMPKYAHAVASALKDPSPIVAMIAARSLFRPGHERHFPAVLEHLPRFTGWSRGFLASMLAGGGPRSAPLLRAILASDMEPPLVRAVASDALRELNDLPSVPTAVGLLEGMADRDRELVVGCLRILEQLGHQEHLPVVRPFVDSPDAVVRASGVSALAALGGEDEIPALQSKLDDTTFWVSLEAARGLMSLGEMATLERIAGSRGPWSLLAQQVLSE
ncbi:MAG: hypothetical protein HKN72_13440 [Gemmatimonadetes bacterium]|nr:hypothetical protein [Gemmatimonadota bacterium]NNL31210.1 hypothetical protein [Gemmatimonadota bacterium]